MISMRIEGGDKLAEILDAIPKRASRDRQRDALLAGGELIRARAASLAPRAPGAPDLAENINIGTVRSSVEGEVSVGIGSGRYFFYDMFQEFGTSRHSAHPFYRPAMDSEAAKAIKVIGLSLWSALTAGGFTSARIGQGSSESFAGPREPMVFGGPSGSLL
jgi:HK97 gp10 family phage protein